MKYKYYISCQFVETDASKANLHTENEVTYIVDKKKKKKKKEKKRKKRLPSFLHMFSKVKHLTGLMTVTVN